MSSASALTLDQSSTLPPAQPTYILRGHAAQIHAVHFLRENLRLLSGDADGWVVLWNLPIRRPVAVWQAHSATILGLESWGLDKIITHGRDGKLKVWQLPPDDESTFSTVLPIEDIGAEERKQPWLLHSLHVNTLNFCGFAITHVPCTEPTENGSRVLIATPGVHDGTVSLTYLPGETRHSTIPPPRDIKTGMLMAVAIHQSRETVSSTNGPALVVLAGYESGHAACWRLNSSSRWETQYIHKPHSQPILSLSVAPKLGRWYSSSADATISCYPLDLSGEAALGEIKTINTKHAGQQGLRVRSDEKIFATAGWDGRMRVYSTRDMRELAVLKWHREGCYAVAFADIHDISTEENTGLASKELETMQRNLTVAEQRSARTQATHWLAAGSKDGKVSLWEIY